MYTKIFIFRSYVDEGGKVYPKNLQIKNQKSRVSRLPSKIFYEKINQGIAKYKRVFKIFNNKIYFKINLSFFYVILSFQYLGNDKKPYGHDVCLLIKDKQVVGVDRICRGEAGYVRDIQGDTKDSGTKFFFKVSTNEEIKEFNS